ncbi:hypothetical protein PIB30_060301 [Stylosanthes scabra]|uniref:Uncharacterized protein n=1 Tax=Stylosanthes scabra TaxID=79078 RepID=A0ABU6YJD9_9FABA|nr:hypothetical protein [Stylosanthes scabra]
MAASARFTAAMVLLAVATSLFHFTQASAPSVGEFVDTTINSHTIVIFSKSYCPNLKTFHEPHTRKGGKGIDAMQQLE